MLLTLQDHLFQFWDRQSIVVALKHLLLAARRKFLIEEMDARVGFLQQMFKRRTLGDDVCAGAGSGGRSSGGISLPGGLGFTQIDLFCLGVKLVNIVVRQEGLAE
jgi:hypothetical protein